MVQWSMEERPVQRTACTFCIGVMTMALAAASTWTAEGAVASTADADRPTALQDDDTSRVRVAELSPCGTVLTPEVMAETQRLVDDGTWDLARRWNDGQTRGLPSFIRVTIHVVRYDNGTGGLAQYRIDAAMEDLNQHQADNGLVFFQEGETRFIDNTDLANYDANTDFCSVVNTDHIPGTVNVYFVPVANVCGHASFPGGSCQGIIVANACTPPAAYHTFCHEMGHYLHLPHTHETAWGSECVDGSNCATAGDLICDTPADPNLWGLPTCNYNWTDTDPCGSGQLYSPMVENVMAYSLDYCQDVFTAEQKSVKPAGLEKTVAERLMSVLTTLLARHGYSSPRTSRPFRRR